MIAYVALHQLGYGDIMLPQEAEFDDGAVRAEFYATELVPLTQSEHGEVYYDAVSCYSTMGHRVRLFSTGPRWVTEGEWVTITAQDR